MAFRCYTFFDRIHPKESITDWTHCDCDCFEINEHFDSIIKLNLTSKQFNLIELNRIYRHVVI